MGHAWSQFVLGEIYEEGEHVPRDLKKAALWYRRAAEQGHEFAETQLEQLVEQLQLDEALREAAAAEASGGGDSAVTEVA